MSHQNLKKISGIFIAHKRNKIGKNEGFSKKPLFHTAQFLQKMALNTMLSVNSTGLPNFPFEQHRWVMSLVDALPLYLSNTTE